MRRKKLISLSTQRDIEAACERMDRRERDVPEAYDRDVADFDDDERTLLMRAHSAAFDDAW